VGLFERGGVSPIRIFEFLSGEDQIGSKHMVKKNEVAFRGIDVVLDGIILLCSDGVTAI